MKKQRSLKVSFVNFLRLTIVSVLSLQIAVGQALAQTEDADVPLGLFDAPREVKPPDPGGDLETNQVLRDYYLDPDNQAFSQKILAFDDAYSKNTLPPSESNYDPFNLANQRVEIVSNNVVTELHSLNDYTIAPPDVQHSSLRLRYSTETRELIFEGIVGTRNDGTQGDVVARHIIPNMDVASYTKDLEMLSIIDSKGRLHVIDMGHVMDQLFKSPIPVVKNVWKPRTEFLQTYHPTSYRMQYHHRTVAPYRQDQLTEFSEIPQRVDGRVLLEAGAVYITFADGSGQEKVLGYISRNVIYERLEQAAQVLLTEGTLINPKKEFLDFLGKRLAGQMPNENILKMNPLIRNYLSNLDVSQLTTLKNRVEANKKAQSQMRDQYSLDELIANAERIQSEYNSAKEKAQLEGQEFEASLKESFDAFMAPVPRQNPFPKKQTAMSKFLHVIDSKTFRMLGAIAATSVVGAYVTFPFLRDSGLSGMEIPALNWIYENMYSELMRDAYKYTLVKSMFSMLMMAPLVIYGCVFMQSMLKRLNAHVQNKTDWWAIKVRDVFKNWGHLSKWEFMGSLGLRKVFLYSYPAITAVVKFIFQQRALLSAVERGVNPFKLIRKDSTLGKMLDLESTQFAGFMHPQFNALKFKNPIENFFRLRQALKKSENTKMKIQSALVNQKRRVRNLSMTLATLIVGEHYQVDPATLVMLMSEDLKAEDLIKIYQDPKTSRDWNLLIRDIYKSLLAENSELLLNKDVAEIDREELKMYAQIATEKAIALQSRSAMSNKIRYLSYIRAVEIGETIVNNLPFINLGREKLSHLRSLYVNRFMADQGRREFWLDYPVSIFTFGVVGGRADFSKPQDLSAATTMRVGDTETALPMGYLFTNPQHFYDMAYTLYSGLFTSFARMIIVFQNQIKALPELSYLPKHYQTLKSDPRMQNIFGAFWDWTNDVFNFEKSDLGRVFANSYFSRLATAQAGLIMTLMFRLALVPVGPEVGILENIYQASAGFFLYMIWAQWQYGVIEDTVRKGNSLHAEKFEELNRRHDDAKLKLEMGLNEPNRDKSLALIDEAYKELIDLYNLQNSSALKKVVREYRHAFKKYTATQNKYSANEHPANETSATAISPYKLSRNLTAAEQKYYGLLIEAAVAMRDHNSENLERATLALKQVLVTDTADLTPETVLDIEKLNARSILNYALTNPPVYTKENKTLYWVSQTASLIAATYLSIDLSIMIFKPNELQVGTLLETTLLSAALVPISFVIFGKNAGYYYNKIFAKTGNHAKTKTRNAFATLGFAKTSAGTVSTSSVPAQQAPSPSVPLLCQGYFY